ncbi:hypothetical protein ACHQM5_002408 [Ranunculus cassubicifolius]
MKTLPFGQHMIVALVFFFFTSTNSYLTATSVTDSVYEVKDPSITYTYARYDEVVKECRSVLSTATELKSDAHLADRIKNELSFINGDWEQAAEQVTPLLPFDDKDLSKKDSDSQPPFKLASFWVTDVDSDHRSKKTYSVSGMLYMGITRNGSFAVRPYDERTPHFQIWPGMSQLMILFQGVYFESEKNGGERGLCLLGNAMLPSREKDSTDPWEWVKGSNYYPPPLLQDDQILLVLSYPRTLTLTSRAVFGDLKSLNRESSQKYFSKVQISSQLGAYANYEFGSRELVARACNPYPYKDKLMDSTIDVYSGSDFCGILERFTYREGFTVVPNWNCNGTDEYCSKLGPFDSGKVIEASDGGFKNVKLIIQDVRCEPRFGAGNSSARVSSVFRVVSPLENQLTAVERSGLSNMTLRAEGMWNSSSGQLCMIGCLGAVSKGPENCGSRVCLYVPISFSITQRSIAVGSISSINNKSTSYFPLSFEKLVEPAELMDRFSASHLFYKYSKIEAAGAFLEKSEAFDFRAVIKKSLLSYPALDDEVDYLVSLSLLTEDLTLHVSAIQDPLPKYRPSRTSVDMEIVSLGPLFGRYWSSGNRSTGEGGIPLHNKEEFTESQLLLNVSAQLTLTGMYNTNISLLFLEGLYDSRVGKMYLIGCRDVRASWKILFESRDLQNGLDCLIEVKLEYPPTTARWLVSPTAKISISSQRNEDDPLYFSPVGIMTLPLLYRKQREDILSRKGIEGILRILTLSLAISCIISQLLYVREKVDAVPFMSLVMLCVQALGYSLPLITGAEALFKHISSESYETPSYDLENSQWFHIIDYTVKFLILVAFLLTLRLSQKVWKSRIRLLTRTPLEPGRVPSDRRVLLATLVVHTIGFILVLVVHAVNARDRPASSRRYVDSRGNSYTLKEWEMELEEYVGLIQDFFLLPQIFGNVLWQINVKPLRKFYYIGITAVRLLPHIYDYSMSPVPNPYFSEEYEFVNPSMDFYSKFGDIAIPVTAVVLSIVIFIQQRWSYDKLSLTLSNRKLLPLGSKVYERLPSVSVEAELVSGVNETGTREETRE